MSAYYNEIDPYCAAWLRNLIAAGHIAPGDVDERSIVDVRADDLRGYQQCHFFAGICGWSYALRLAGWSDDRPVWTGSCPCQPFSAAGKGEAADDERHLWPAWFSLIRECRPAAVFGEQVEAAIGWGWLDAVFSDLEAEGYACGASVLPACSVGAPHRRDRLWFVAHSLYGDRRAFDGHRQDERDGQDVGRPQAYGESRTCSEVRGLADADGRHASAEELQRGGQHRQWTQDGGVGGGLGHADNDRPQRGTEQTLQRPGRREEGRAIGCTSGPFWSDLVWLPCSDGKARPTECTLQCFPDGLSDSLGYLRTGEGCVLSPLIKGSKNRIGRLRAYGNAIVPQVAAEFIKAVM